MRLILSFFKYLLFRQGAHGLHSPFVYQFLTKGIRANIDKNFLKQRRNLILKYLADKKSIEVHDFGAGSKQQGKQRTVQSIFKNAASKGKKGLLLYRITSFLQPKNILELGSSIGFGTFQMINASKLSKITSLEACPETFRIASDYLQSYQDRLTLLNTTFADFLNDQNQKIFDMIFIDGHHHGPSLLKYLEMLDTWMHDETIIVLDDIYWSKDMQEAWEKIKGDEKYHLTIDLFHFGVIAKRQHQRKEHFILKNQ